MTYLTNIDLNQNELQNAVLQNLASAPTNPKKGQKYFNTTLNKECTWNGTSWDTGSTMTGDAIIDTLNSSTKQIDDNNLSSLAQTAINNSHTHTNKTLLDSYTQTNTDLASAVTTKHTHSNKALLDTYTQTDTNLASAVSSKHTHTNQALLDTYTQTNTDLASAIASKHTPNSDTGTSSNSFFIGTSGIKLVNNGGYQLQLRNMNDSDCIDLKVRDLTVSGTTTYINSNTVEIGDNLIELNTNIADISQNSDGGIAVKRLDDTHTRKDAELLFNNSLGKWQTVSCAISESPVTAQIANKVVSTVGDGTATSFVITHNLNTRDLSISIRATNTPYNMVFTDIEFTSLNTITLYFANPPTSNQYTVTMVG